MENYREKYERLKSKAITLHRLACETSHENTRMCIEELFPELKESEDEGVKKALIGHLKECRNNTRSEVMLDEYTKWIAWLEKQKSTELDETSYQVGIKRVLENPESYGLTKQNIAWGEEDKKTIDSILGDLRQGVVPDEEDLQWLKSLKERMKGDKE